MSTTVDIVIKGVAICYRKGESWHILFPIDAERCHKINFFSKKGDDSSISNGSLAGAGSIEITASKALSVIGQTDNFKDRVLDLTSARTHPRVRLKSDSAGKYVLMTIPSARFSVHKFLEEFPGVAGKIPPLTEVTSSNTTSLNSLAHSARASIVLDDGGQVFVKGGALNFETQSGFSYTLIFDNDCEQTVPGRNDMDMFYDVVEEDVAGGGNPSRHFRIGNVGPSAQGGESEEEKDSAESKENQEKSFNDVPFKFFVEPPNFAVGKPCLCAQVSDSESIKNLP